MGKDVIQKIAMKLLFGFLKNSSALIKTSSWILWKPPVLRYTCFSCKSAERDIQQTLALAIKQLVFASKSHNNPNNWIPTVLSSIPGDNLGLREQDSHQTSRRPSLGLQPYTSEKQVCFIKIILSFQASHMKYQISSHHTRRNQGLCLLQ